METGRAYLDYVPSHEWLLDEAADTLVVHVPGIRFLTCFYVLSTSIFCVRLKATICLSICFLRLQKGAAQGSHWQGWEATRQRRTSLDGLINDQWSRFRKEFQLPENCNADQVRGKLENGLVSIVLPKLPHQDAGKEEKEKGGVKQREGDVASMTAPAPPQGDEKTKLKSTVSMDVRLQPREGKLLVVGLLVAVVAAAWYLYQKLNAAETQPHGACAAL